MIVASRKLTPRQQRFVDEYLKSPVASQAAVRAGYSARTAEWIGPQLLKKPHIAAAIGSGQQAIAERAAVEAEEVVRQLAMIAFADVRRLFDRDGNLLPIEEIDPATAMAIASYDVSVDPATGVRRARVRFWDKNSALEKLMKHLGLFERDNRQGADPLADLIEHILERGSRLPLRHVSPR